MKILVYTILFCFCFPTLSAQHITESTDKPPIDTADILNWPVIPDGSNAIISNNGEYLLYKVWRIPRGGTSTIIRSLKKEWGTALIGANQAVFTDDSRHVI